MPGLGHRPQEQKFLRRFLEHDRRKRDHAACYLRGRFTFQDRLR
jgi:hypothetical protein